MFKPLRSMLEEDSPIGGKGRSVEMDEAYFGGRRKGGGGRRLRGDRGAQYKTLVFGIAERKGRIIAKTADNASGATLLPPGRAYVMPKSTVVRAELPSYRCIPHTTDQRYVHR